MFKHKNMMTATEFCTTLVWHRKLDVTIIMTMKINVILRKRRYIVASELKDPICHSDECQIGSFSSEATICKNSADMGFIIINDSTNATV